jgi:UDP-N-acetylglucosamine kinase
MPSDEEITRSSTKYAQKNAKKIAATIASSLTSKEDRPITILMAGSPGAGKTEYSKNFLEIVRLEMGLDVFRLDPDELRKYFVEYDGKNASLFQNAVSILVGRLFQALVVTKSSFLLDGTLANYDKAAANIEKCLQENREVLIFYIYQHPLVAWDFTVAREQEEGRRITKEAFIRGFINSRTNIQRIKNTYGHRVTVQVIIKDYTNYQILGAQELAIGGPTIDEILGDSYTEKQLENMIDSQEALRSSL